MRYQLTFIRLATVKTTTTKVTSVYEDVEKLEYLYTAGGNVKRCGRCRKWCGGSSKKINRELPYELVIPHLGIYPKELEVGA